MRCVREGRRQRWGVMGEVDRDLLFLPWTCGQAVIDEAGAQPWVS